MEKSWWINALGVGLFALQVMAGLVFSFVLSLSGSAALSQFLFTLMMVEAGIGIMFIAGGLFLQGYFYTETSSGLYWQAPAAAVLMTVFFFIWSWLNFSIMTREAKTLPYDTILNASATVDMTEQPVKRLEVIYKGKKDPVVYVRNKYVEGAKLLEEYLVEGTTKRWRREGVEAILLKHEDRTIRFEPVKDSNYYESSEGWFMMEYDRGITGQPQVFHIGLLFTVMFINFIHLALWFVGLWLIMRFQFWHAVGLALALWFGATLLLVPWLLNEAKNVAQQVPAA